MNKPVQSLMKLIQETILKNLLIEGIHYQHCVVSFGSIRLIFMVILTFP